MKESEFIEKHSWQAPDLIDSTAVRSLLTWVGENGFTDLKIMADYPPMVQKTKGFHRLNTRTFTADEANEFYIELKNRDSADNELYAGKGDDFNYTLPASTSGERFGFRVCATACRPTQASKKGIDIILRTIPGVPPTLEWNKLPPSLNKAMLEMGGLIMVVGAVNSGKSTLLAGVIRHNVENRWLNGYTIENPCEYDFSQLENINIPVTQQEVGSDLRDFGGTLRMLLRKSTHYVMYGESRDTESIKAMSLAAETGMTVYTTVHAHSVADALGRMVRDFRQEEQFSMMQAFLSQTRVIVYQRLLVKEDGTRCAVREYIVLTKKDRDMLRVMDMSEIPLKIQEMQKARKTDLQSGLDFLYRTDEISREQLEYELKMAKH